MNMETVPWQKVFAAHAERNSLRKRLSRAEAERDAARREARELVNAAIRHKRRANDALARAEVAEAALERVQALLVHAGTYGPDEFGAFKRDLSMAALAPVTEEGDKENGEYE